MNFNTFPNDFSQQIPQTSNHVLNFEASLRDIYSQEMIDNVTPEQIFSDEHSIDSSKQKAICLLPPEPPLLCRVDSFPSIPSFLTNKPHSSKSNSFSKLSTSFETVTLPTSDAPPKPFYVVATHFRVACSLGDIAELISRAFQANPTLSYQFANFSWTAVYMNGSTYSQFQVSIFRDDLEFIVEANRLKGDSHEFHRFFNLVRNQAQKNFPGTFSCSLPAPKQASTPLPLPSSNSHSFLSGPSTPLSFPPPVSLRRGSSSPTPFLGLPLSPGSSSSPSFPMPPPPSLSRGSGLSSSGSSGDVRESVFLARDSMLDSFDGCLPSMCLPSGSSPFSLPMSSDCPFLMSSTDLDGSFPLPPELTSSSSSTLSDLDYPMPEMTLEDMIAPSSSSTSSSSLPQGFSFPTVIEDNEQVLSLALDNILKTAREPYLEAQLHACELLSELTSSSQSLCHPGLQQLIGQNEEILALLVKFANYDCSSLASALESSSLPGAKFSGPGGLSERICYLSLCCLLNLSSSVPFQESVVNSGVIPRVLSLATNGPYYNLELRKTAALILSALSAVPRLGPALVSAAGGPSSVLHWAQSLDGVNDQLRLHAERAKRSLLLHAQ